ncbi:L-threonylcarbamoyladenylate synthase [Neisseria sp. ZJ106]|uniref:Threonylcarbamoyl-AMP synthase n=1 Tax=Neisseria lisongii TaxID=2912188 RepID=A0ABY7RKI3_9NEIS|nr:L-threonylcarbamoyladenylate synthase [Neisseria lisongii]MCF7520907.1 L-threonylcarbamoyladenylate synthase [Neisseria lisongii]WCL71286.1 L-threonylcarbamoyladenylate synthase [Neisseria lisongii]
MKPFPRILAAADQRRLTAHLQRNGLVAYPTESCYGLGCLPTAVRAVKQLIRLKKRPQHKGMIVIGADFSQLQPLLRPSEKNAALLQQPQTLPTTFLLPASRKITPTLRGSRRNKLAVRIPAHAGAKRLCRMLQTPLVSTSCNQAGKKPCRSEREVRRLFGRRVWVVGGLVGRYKQPSRIIDGETGKRLR